MSVRVLHCDDSGAFRAMLRAAIGDVVDFVGEAVDHDGAVAAARRTQPDVVLLDLLDNGEDPVARLRDAAPAARIVVLTGHEREYGRSVRPGADAYVEKGEPIDVLLAAIADG